MKTSSVPPPPAESHNSSSIRSAESPLGRSSATAEPIQYPQSIYKDDPSPGRTPLSGAADVQKNSDVSTHHAIPCWLSQDEKVNLFDLISSNTFAAWLASDQPLRLSQCIFYKAFCGPWDSFHKMHSVLTGIQICPSCRHFWWSKS